MSKPKRERWPKNMMGKHCGYTLYEDGGIGVAPTYSNQMQEAVESENAISAVLDAVTKQCHALMLQVTQKKRIFWDGVKEDYGLDFSKNSYQYNHQTHTIIIKKEKDEP